MEPKQATHCNYFDVFSLLCSYYVIDMIKKLELRLLVVTILFKIEFGHADVETACFNLWLKLFFSILLFMASPKVV